MFGLSGFYVILLGLVVLFIIYLGCMYWLSYLTWIRVLVPLLVVVVIASISTVLFVQFVNKAERKPVFISEMDLQQFAEDDGKVVYYVEDNGEVIFTEKFEEGQTSFKAVHVPKDAVTFDETLGKAKVTVFGRTFKSDFVSWYYGNEDAEKLGSIPVSYTLHIPSEVIHTDDLDEDEIVENVKVLRGE